MCGIVGIVSRPPTRPAPTAAEVLAGLDAALAARGDVAGRDGRAAGASTTLLHGVPGLLALTATADLPAAITARLDQLDAYAADVDADAGDARRSTPTRSRRRAPSSIALRDVLWAIRRDRLRTAAAVAALAGGDAGAGRARRLPVDPAGAVGDRPHGGARPRLGRHPRVRVGPRPRRRRPGDRRRRSPSAAATRCSRPARPGSPGACLSFVYKAAAEIGELGDNTARDARGDRRRRPAAAGAARRPRPRSPCSATPAGRASASSPSPTPTR